MSQKNQWDSVFGYATHRRAAGCLFGALALAGSLAFERTASAQHRFGDKGQLAVTGENLFAVSTQTVKWDQPGGRFANTSNRTSFLFSTYGGGEDITNLAGPRVGIHYFIIPNLSIGGTIGFEARGGNRTNPEGNGVLRTRDKNDEATFLFLPKVGYALMFSDVVGFWFRGGIGYTQNTVTDPTNTNDRTKFSFWLLSLDAPLIISPVPHFAFYVGPQVEFSFAGTFTEPAGGPPGGTVSWGASYFNLNLQAGMLAYFDL